MRETSTTERGTIFLMPAEERREVACADFGLHRRLDRATEDVILDHPCAPGRLARPLALVPPNPAPEVDYRHVWAGCEEIRLGEPIRVLLMPAGACSGCSVWKWGDRRFPPLLTSCTLPAGVYGSPPTRDWAGPAPAVEPAARGATPMKRVSSQHEGHMQRPFSQAGRSPVRSMTAVFPRRFLEFFRA